MSKSSILVKLTPTLNRSQVLTTYMQGPIHFAINYHRITPAIQFILENKNPLIQKNIIKVQMFRNLDKCDFCTTFFDMETFVKEGYDVRGKFSGVNRMNESNLIRCATEKLDFYTEGKKNSQNGLLILGWKIIGLEDDFLFYFVQRKCFNTKTRTRLIRTAGLQFATERGLNGIQNYIKNFNDTVEQNKISKTEMDVFYKNFNKSNDEDDYDYDYDYDYDIVGDDYEEVED